MLREGDRVIDCDPRSSGREGVIVEIIERKVQGLVSVHTVRDRVRVRWLSGKNSVTEISVSKIKGSKKDGSSYRSGYYSPSMGFVRQFLS